MHHLVTIPDFDASYALLSDDETTHTAVVFVHGFMGDAAGTWRDFPRLIEADRAWDQTDLYFFDYDSFGESVTTSSERLREFMAVVEPPTQQLFQVPDPILMILGNVDASVSPFVVRNVLRPYEELVLVGHSLGGLVIRALVREEMKRRKGGSGARLLDARLRLFAPAIAGARLAGLLGLAFQAKGLGAALGMATGSSPSFKEVQQGSALLTTIREDTVEFATRFPQIAALRAEIIWAARDDVVSDIDYRCDSSTTPRPNHTSHRTVCKPTDRYRLPIDFVLS